MRYRYDNLLTISGSFFAENFIDDPFANAPVKQGKAGVDGCGDARRASPMIWRISSIKAGETTLTLSLLVGDFVCLRAIIHSLTASSRIPFGGTLFTMKR
jgi:hypothetical protein